MAQTLLTKTASFPTPIDGYDHNSSNDFSLGPIANTVSYTFKVISTSEDDANKIYFNVWEDKNNKRDDLLWGSKEIKLEKVHNGYTTSENLELFDSVYIGDPEGANDSFEVEIYANTNE